MPDGGRTRSLAATGPGTSEKVAFGAPGPSKMADSSFVAAGKRRDFCRLRYTQ
jgi:hypothetical protein